MKQIHKRLAALLMAFAVAALCAAPAFAVTSADVDLSKKGSITVTLRDSKTDAEIVGGRLTLYQVASVKKENANLSYVYTNGFENCGVSLGDLSESDLAEQLEAKRTAASKGTTVTVNSSGKAVFSDLSLGLYLVVQTTASTGYEKINPFIVSVPLLDGGRYLYDVDALPKVGTLTKTTPPDVPEIPDVPETPDLPDVPVVPDTPVQPDVPQTPETPTTPETPETPQNPTPDTPGDNPVAPEVPDWPLDEDGHPIPPDADNPDGWVLNGRPDKKNAPNPDNPDGWVLNGRPSKNALPQTGQLNWPIPVLACTGIVLMAAGAALRKKR